MQPTLVILAAGMASRYGGMKQVEGFGPHNETIMDYSIYDAIKAGFGKVVFIIREDFAESFKSVFEPKLAGKIKTEYVYQKLDAFIGNRTIPADRTKPWGTAHALLCCKDVLKEPFAVINADDFYGKDGFEKAAAFLNTKCADDLYALIGYSLVNTLSENGSVSRGVCKIDEAGNLVGIDERTNIYPKDGVIVYEEDGKTTELAPDTQVSMNFYCLGSSFIPFAEKLFEQFLDTQINTPKSEFFIPKTADQFIKSKLGSIEVIPTSAKWFGVTYKEDAPGVRESLHKLIANGEYPASLWGA
ncbi:NDP-sugar synthase [Parasediminibacterium sp. JCM 36343]|uniref:nucleotidyltransferase family protein n=1 Tax=Parasediminibacterium sp. JCM 36343 TaxID=3374279 RepID=UPI00397AA164